MEQLTSIRNKTLKAECVGRFSLNPKTFKSVIDLMQAKLVEYEEQENQSNGATI